MNENEVMITKDGKELPLPPIDPVKEGIVVPEGLVDGKQQ